MARSLSSIILPSTPIGRGRRPTGSTTTTPAIGHRSTMRVTATASNSSAWSWATTSIPKSASCDVTTCEGTSAVQGQPAAANDQVVSKFSSKGAIVYIENGGAGSKRATYPANSPLEFQNSDRFYVGYGGLYEFLPRPFTDRAGVILPSGGYDYASARIGFNFGRQRNGRAMFWRNTALSTTATRPASGQRRPPEPDAPVLGRAHLLTQ